MEGLTDLLDQDEIEYNMKLFDTADGVADMGDDLFVSAMM